MNGLNICPKCLVVIGQYGQCNCNSRSRWGAGFAAMLFVAMLLWSAPVFAQAPANVVIHGLDISPSSGNWNHPDAFRIQNATDAPITVRWLLDCYNSLFCESDSGVTVIEPEEIVFWGLGKVCSGWQLDMWWDGAPPWGAVAEPENCPSSLPPGAEPVIKFHLWLPSVAS